MILINERRFRMEKVIKIINQRSELDEDILFWQSKTAEERISAVQILREQFIVLFNKQQLYDESRKRLRRVCRAVKQA